ncbi:MAG: DnaJ domain-containing protein [Thermoproteota archaeon]|nr:DnaJ domain-containing protein [Thermoproteota archaeon]
MDNKGYYSILEVSEHANYREIRSAFRRLAKKYHPDLNSSVHAEEMIKKINAAFEVLSDKERRREYDSLCLNDNNVWSKQNEENLREDSTKNKSDSSKTNNADSYSAGDKDNTEGRSGHHHHHLYSDFKDNGKSETDDYYSRKNIKQRIVKQSGVATDASNIKARSRFQIIVEPSLCMAFGSCETLAPRVFAVEKDKIFNPKVKVVSEIDEDLDVVLAAAETCPTKAILIIDRDTGQYIYP